MKTLYESILDDEESLIGNSIKDTQNPFRVLKIKYDELKNGYRAWERYAEEVMSKIPLPERMSYFIRKDFIRIDIKILQLLYLKFHLDVNLLYYQKMLAVY